MDFALWLLLRPIKGGCVVQKHVLTIGGSRDSSLSASGLLPFLLLLLKVLQIVLAKFCKQNLDIKKFKKIDHGPGIIM